jgi:hypothetical protein
MFWKIILYAGNKQRGDVGVRWRENVLRRRRNLSGTWKWPATAAATTTTHTSSTTG